ncbi:MAG: NAD(P)H-dependent oxidoreductase [Alysiella sp.]|uniref:NAD(P)H-dependent oxidoreductase n=1 Tax=Alysiella sp. TaxID=1872483 RepID=UPI0026DC2FBF|nr:NAD(P)H-dependent oxidoreductase [Alysiella sp.]MDO4434490.1 NAD(P)H-dependent oxidoreductase [Alysiella sp.]
MTVFLKPEQLIEVLRQRTATRTYNPERKISDNDFAAILECARLSPSSVGSEPWRFLVVQNPAVRQSLKPVCWGMATQINDASHIVVILAKKNARYDSPFFQDVIARRGFVGEEAANAMHKYGRFQQDDIAILDSERSLFDWASKQTYIALANMMTGAALLGIDSCPIEGFNYAAVNQIMSEQGLFDHAEWGVSVMLTLGYRAKDIKPKSRKSSDEIVQWIA